MNVRGGGCERERVSVRVRIRIRVRVRIRAEGRRLRSGLGSRPDGPQ